MADFSEGTENQANILELIGNGVQYDLWVAWKCIRVCMEGYVNLQPLLREWLLELHIQRYGVVCCVGEYGGVLEVDG